MVKRRTATRSEQIDVVVDLLDQLLRELRASRIHRKRSFDAARMQTTTGGVIDEALQSVGRS